MRDKEKITDQKMDRKEGDIMEEMMAMIRDPPKLTNQTITQPTITTQYSSWKLYENPFYYSRSSYPHHHHSISPLNYLTPSARKLAACLWDLTFIRSIMDSELDIARAKIHELKAELEFERKARKKAETVNKKLCKQLSEERKRRQAVEDVCEKLAKEIASEKVEMDRMKKDMVEERKMLRVAEVLREERVQMKLTDAKILFEEKISELEFSTKATSESALASKKEQQQRMVGTVTSNEPTGMTSTVNSITSSYSNVRSTENKRRASPEAENPHIKRGIKGFVEFPRVVRAISSRGRHLGSKVECQKAQLRLLLRQKSPFRTDNLIIG